MTLLKIKKMGGTQMTSKVLKETFSDEQTTVSEVDADELHKHISKNDSHTISDIVFDALIDMGIDQDGFAWDINVTVQQNNDPIAKIGAVNENDALDMTIRIMDKLSEMKILNKKQSRDEDFAIQDAITKEIEIVFNRMSLKDQIDNNSISIGEFHNEK